MLIPSSHRLLLQGTRGSLPELSRFPQQTGLSPLKKAKGGNHVQVIFLTGCNLSRNPRLRMPRENVGKGRVYAMFRRRSPLKKAKGGTHSGIGSDWTNPFSPQTIIVEVWKGQGQRSINAL